MQSGSLRLFRVAGIDVYLHFTWFIVGAYEMTVLADRYESPIWGAYEYLALFAIVLMHEFGHALACRQTGGRADHIVLWPLGGVAFVQPPPRPGAVLWSIVAGPLVNVVLVPVLWIALLIGRRQGWIFDAPDAVQFLRTLFLINGAVLIFNLLPIYPLDGGQILRALLWFPFGRIRSLQVAAVVGLLGGAALVLYALWLGSIWLGILAFFVLSQAAAGWQQAKVLVLEEEEARRIRSEGPPPPV